MNPELIDVYWLIILVCVVFSALVALLLRRLERLEEVVRWMRAHGVLPPGLE